MLDFFTNCSNLCQLTVATSSAPCIFHSRYQVNFARWGNPARVIFKVKICIFERSNEERHFSKTKIYFYKKNCTTIIRTYWATKYKSRSENEFWATCHNISNLFDGCWHPLLKKINLKKILTRQKLLIIFSSLFRTHERDTVNIIHLCKFTSCLEINFVFKVCRRPPFIST